MTRVLTWAALAAVPFGVAVETRAGEDADGPPAAYQSMGQPLLRFTADRRTVGVFDPREGEWITAKLAAPALEDKDGLTFSRPVVQTEKSVAALSAAKRRWVEVKVPAAEVAGVMGHYNGPPVVVTAADVYAFSDAKAEWVKLKGVVTPPAADGSITYGQPYIQSNGLVSVATQDAEYAFSETAGKWAKFETGAAKD